MRIELPYNWEPRTYQIPVWKHFEPNEEGQRGVCVWHRRAGKDVCGINLIACKSQIRVGTYWHLLPTYKQGRAIVWDGFTREGRPFLDFFPKHLVAKKIENQMKIYFNNGSIYQVVGTDDINSLVGTNPVGCVLSEYSLHDPLVWDYLRPILRENGGWALFIFTPRGNNHGYRLFKMATDNPDWFCEKLTVSNTFRRPGLPVISESDIAKDVVEGMANEMVQQEYYCSFDAPLVGAYYSVQLTLAHQQGRICKVPYEPNLPVDTAWDLGMDDSTSIIFTQTFGMEERIIDYYENSGEGLAHYARIIRERDFHYGRHYAPWDIEVRSLSTGVTRKETAARLGVKFHVVSQHDIMDGIEQCRNVLARCWFDGVKCERLIDALKSYTKERDEKRNVFRDSPLHNWASHGADAFRTFAMSRRRSSTQTTKPQEVAVDDHRYL